MKGLHFVFGFIFQEHTYYTEPSCLAWGVAKKRSDLQIYCLWVHSRWEV